MQTLPVSTHRSLLDPPGVIPHLRGSGRHLPTSPGPRNGDEDMLLCDGRSLCSP